MEGVPFCDHKEAEVRDGRKADLQKAKARMQTDLLPRQTVFSIAISPSGSFVFCGTHSGVCALLWNDLLKADGATAIDPKGFVPAEPVVQGDAASHQRLIYSIPIDAPTNRFLYAGLEGKIGYANCSEDKTGTLLSPPIRMPFSQLELTPDRTRLVGTAIAQPGVRKPTPSHFQIWNYQILCERAGIPW